MKKIIMFDLDGTLTDSGEGIINSAAYALERFGLPVPDRKTMRQFVGPPLRDTFILFGVPAERAEEAVAVYRERYLPIGKYENHPYPGVHDLLEKLKSNGHKLYVATSKPEALSIEIMERFGLAKYFDRICGATLDGSRDEKSKVIAYLLAETGSSNQATMVGDTAFDVLGAAAHGIPTVGVSWGYGEVSDMEKAGAKAIAHNMDELYTLLTE